MNEEKSKFELRRYLYYFIIGVISLIAVVFLPMIGSEAGLGWNLPNTTVGWIVWATGRVIVAVINILLFHSFMMQGKLNVKDHPRYVEARDILMNKNVKGYEPKSPAQFFGKKWRTKGITIAVSSLLSTVALTQAVLTFDYITMLSYLFTIIMGVIFGILTMKEVEDYYTGEYWQYAQRHKVEMKEKQETEQNRESGDVGPTGPQGLTGQSVDINGVNHLHVIVGKEGLKWLDDRDELKEKKENKDNGNHLHVIVGKEGLKWLDDKDELKEKKENKDNGNNN